VQRRELGERLWTRTVEQVVETVTQVAAKGIEQPDECC
jgi:hypothetical protein